MKTLLSEELPPTADEYFTFYKTRAYSELVSPSSIEAVLLELRLAYQKYVDRQPRIKEMARVLKTGLKRPLPKMLPSEWKPSLLEDKVRQALT